MNRQRQLLAEKRQSNTNQVLCPLAFTAYH